ncbi:MAG: hypothetical protein JWO31_1980 [Phycisphaerales bacterium]|nr:hypothetical protein [Phycisphaerales bacterium]
MTWPILGTVLKYLGRAVSGPAATARAAAAATATTAHAVASLFGGPWIADLRRIKEAELKKVDAAASAASAEAQKKVAEAAEASARANLHKRNDRLAKIERDRLAADAAQARAAAAKTQAEADAIRSDADSRRVAAVAEAKARFIEAISKLQQAGGCVAFDEENLRRIVAQGMASPEANSATPGTAGADRPDGPAASTGTEYDPLLLPGGSAQFATDTQPPPPPPEPSSGP